VGRITTCPQRVYLLSFQTVPLDGEANPPYIFRIRPRVPMAVQG
jgi:hypothetical protein